MRITTTKTFAVLLSLLLLNGCTDDFTSLNTNPNAPVDVQPELLLRQVIFSYADGMSYEGFTGGANLGQYFSADPGFNAFDRGNLLAPQFGGNPWPLLYTNLRDIELVLQKSRASSAFAVYEGPALVLKSLIAANITDIFGDAPYGEAAKGRGGLVNPSYDTQEDIYTGDAGILSNLERAVQTMRDYRGTASLQGDELYAGNLENWIRFANSLRLKYLLRSSQAHSTARNAIVDIYTNEVFIEEETQNAVFQFGAAPNDFRFARARLGDFTNYLMSETIDSTLDLLGDDRQELWFRPNSLNDRTGVRNGLPVGTSVTDASIPGVIWRENSAELKANFMTSWETYFVLAEAAARNMISADPEQLYRIAVEHAFAYWNTPLVAGYLNRPQVAYRGLEQIATQRWLASIGNGYEGWIEWRRTGFPAFLPPLSSLNDGLIPIRFPYPSTEQALNEAAFTDAVNRLGGENSPNIPVWWDR